MEKGRRKGERGRETCQNSIIESLCEELKRFQIFLYLDYYIKSFFFLLDKMARYLNDEFFYFYLSFIESIKLVLLFVEKIMWKRKLIPYIQFDIKIIHRETST